MKPVRLLLLLALATTVAISGCASTAHRIPHGDLLALSQSTPEARGERVRVIQGLGSENDPPPAPRAESGVQVYVVAPIWIGGTPHHHRHHASAPQGGHGSHGGGMGSNLAGAKKDNAKAWLVVAAVVAGALVFTEGTRYDGWVKLHPMHPVHLYGPYGEYTWMPLAHVTPDVAAWARTAVVVEEVGPWQPLGRAPLNRRGFTYSLLLGAAEIALIGDEPQPGFGSHIQMGFFPTHEVGLQLDIGYGWAEDDFANTVFDGRVGLEIDVLPLTAGIFHGGVYGELGVSSRSDDGIQFDDSSGFLGGGGIAQLELTTRLALTLRAGLTRVYGETLTELTGGVSIY
jgi:hypothetical protein